MVTFWNYKRCQGIGKPGLYLVTHEKTAFHSEKVEMLFLSLFYPRI